MRATKGTRLTKENDANAFISAAWSASADIVVIPTERLSEDFFRLGTRLAGNVVQKFANYRIRLAIIDDVSAHVDKSEALRAFVHEANRGQALWFARDLDELEQRLASIRTA